MIQYYNFDINLNLFLLTADGFLQGNFIDDSILENLRSQWTVAMDIPKIFLNVQQLKALLSQNNTIKFVLILK